jgi:hypothetical protein
MRTLLCAAVLLLAAVAPADDKKPTALTDKEAADGWLMLFDGETTFGWKVVKGTAAVKDGRLVVGGEKATRIEYPPIFGDCEVEVRYEATRGQPPARVPLLHFGDKEAHAMSGRGEAGRTWEVGGHVRQALAVEVPAGEACALTSVRLKPRGMKPIFNGKDLAGWKPFAGDKYKSKFEVTPAGELRVTNGPGDLQTEKAYANFVLQLECKTNGKALNSGVFFRCVPGQYQNGYEAQIQNAYKDNDRTKPADFGTGAIYRRIPARKVVSNDNEWFTMTVVADGNRIATWVNGYQTVDWSDDRPADDNPRKGSKTAAGHLSIQGHDPTTDLLFRNIRLAELPEKK